MYSKYLCVLVKVGVKITLGSSSLTKIVTFTPYYVFINQAQVGWSHFTLQRVEQVCVLICFTKGRVSACLIQYVCVFVIVLYLNSSMQVPYVRVCVKTVYYYDLGFCDFNLVCWIFCCCFFCRQYQYK